MGAHARWAPKKRPSLQAGTKRHKTGSLPAKALRLTTQLRCPRPRIRALASVTRLACIDDHLGDIYQDVPVRHVRWDRSSGVIFIGRMHGFSALPALCSMRTADYSSPSTLMRCMVARSAPSKNPQHWFHILEIYRGREHSLGAKYLKALYLTKEGTYAHNWNERLYRRRRLL